LNLEITFVTTRRRKEPHMVISHVGGKFTTGKPWKITVAEAVANIESARHTFHVKVNGQPVEVVVAVHQGNKYVKTAKDGEQPEQLLALPTSPR
jgi:ABC-type hemin transport system substrate-binding protein